MRVFTKVLGIGVVCCFALAVTAQQPPTTKPPAGTQPGVLPGAQPGTQPGKQLGDQNAPRFEAARFLKDHDRNNDGKLSKDELPAAAQDDFAKIDTNKDGSISQEELVQHVQRMAQERPQLIEVVWYAIDIEEPLTAQELQTAYDLLRKLDKNNDGKIDEGELKMLREERKKERIDAIFAALDRNKDGKIGKDEARGLWIDNFSQLDKNGDGALDRQEVDAACSMKAERREQPDNSQPPRKK